MCSRLGWSCRSVGGRTQIGPLRALSGHSGLKGGYCPLAFNLALKLGEGTPSRLCPMAHSVRVERLRVHGVTNHRV